MVGRIQFFRGRAWAGPSFVGRKERSLWVDAVHSNFSRTQMGHTWPHDASWLYNYKQRFLQCWCQGTRTGSYIKLHVRVLGLGASFIFGQGQHWVGAGSLLGDDWIQGTASGPQCHVINVRLWVRYPGTHHCLKAFGTWYRLVLGFWNKTGITQLLCTFSGINRNPLYSFGERPAPQ